MLHLGRVDAHQPRRRGVHRDWVLAEDEHAGAPRCPLDGAVAFHPDDTVHDGEPRHRERTVDVDDALVDACPVEHVLGPSVDGARYYSKHVLHRKRHARPVMALELGHRDDQVSLEHGVGKVEMSQAGEPAGEGPRGDIVAVEVDIASPLLVQNALQPRRSEQMLVVTAMAGSLGDGDLPCIETLEGFDRGRHHRRIRIDHSLRVELHEVRLEQHRWTGDVDTTQPYALDDALDQWRLIALGP